MSTDTRSHHRIPGVRNDWALEWRVSSYLRKASTKAATTSPPASRGAETPTANSEAASFQSRETNERDTALIVRNLPPQYTQVIRGGLVLAAVLLDSFKTAVRRRWL